MRILFLVHVLGRTRHFKNVISGLVDRGHTVILAPASHDGVGQIAEGAV